jgi:hypothetical protein
MDFEFKVIGLQEWDKHDDNLDVIIRTNDNRVYSATFFTMQNLASLMAKNEKTGECAQGTYMWAVDMVIVRDLDLETIRITIEDLIATGEIEWACQEFDSYEE